MRRVATARNAAKLAIITRDGFNWRIIIALCSNWKKTMTVPLTRWEDGSIRITGSRVPIGAILHHYNLGSTPERIAWRFQGLRLFPQTSRILKGPFHPFVDLSISPARGSLQSR